MQFAGSPDKGIDYSNGEVDDYYLLDSDGRLTFAPWNDEKEDFETDFDYERCSSLVGLITHLAHNEIPDTRANAMFDEHDNYCRVGKFNDMPGEEEAARIYDIIPQPLFERCIDEGRTTRETYNNLTDRVTKYKKLQRHEKDSGEKSTEPSRPAARFDAAGNKLKPSSVQEKAKARDGISRADS